MKVRDNSIISILLHSESFWVAVAFAIFIALSYKKSKEIIIKSLDKRIEEIKKRIDEAKKLKEEAEINLIEAKKNLKKLINDKEKIIKNANEEAELIKKKLLDDEKINKQRSNKKIIDRIEQSRNQAILDIKKMALKVSMKSILELFEKEKDIDQTNLIAKSVTNLFNKKKSKSL